MSADEKFFDFPLCFLSKPGTAQTLAQDVLNYAAVRAGFAEMRDYGQEDTKAAMKRLGLSYSNANHRRFLPVHLGANRTGVTFRNPAGALDRHDGLARFRQQWEEKNGADPIVRISAKLVWGLNDETVLNPREFRVLAGIYSVIGRKSCAIISFKMIQARACGCKAPAVHAANGGQLSVRPLTIKQIRSTVQKLHELQFFARCTPDPHGRKTYYSHRLSDAELREKAFKRATYSQAFADETRAADAKLGERIREKKGALKRIGHRAGSIDEAKVEGNLATTPPPAADNQPIPKGTLNSGDEKRAPINRSDEFPESPLFGQKEGTEGAPRGHQEGHREGTFNINPLNRNPDNKNPNNEGSSFASLTEPAPPPVVEDGYLLDGNFLTREDANRLAIEKSKDDPNFFRHLKSAKRIDGKLEVVS